MCLALSSWIATTSLTVAGLVALALAYFYSWSGVDLLIAPLLIALGVTSSAVLAGLRNPWWVIVLFAGIIVAFVIIRYFNLFGLGPVI